MYSSLESIRRSAMQLCRRREVRTAPRVAGDIRHLRLEPLEERRLLAITVNTLIDENNGIGIGAGTSLREAIFSAPLGETIDFSITGTINLTNLGQLSIIKNLKIAGPGADLLTINAYDPTPGVNQGNGNRVFNVDDGNATSLTNFELHGLTLTGGDVTGPGGAIFSAENLIVRDCVITGNVTLAGGSGATKRNGGGIYQLGGNLTIVDTTISNNRALFGGGIYTTGAVSIQKTTFSENRAADGAGIVLNQGSLTLLNSTISGNLATGNGGGVRAMAGNLTLRHSTIFGNVADTDDSGGGNAGRGGGISNLASSVVLDHTLVAGNLRQVDTSEDIIGMVTARYSLIGDNTGVTIVNSGLNLVGNATVRVNPLLGPLADNGGSTKTHTLLPGSPAIDLGDPYAAAGVDGVPLYDQRGETFGRVTDGDGAHGGRLDIGSIESQSFVEPPPLLGDYNEDGKVDSGDYCVWRNTFGQTGTEPFSGADGSGNGSVGPEDYTVWKVHFGEVQSPPGSAALMLVANVDEAFAASVPSPEPTGLSAPSTAFSNLANQAARSATVSISRPTRASSAKFESAVAKTARDHALIAWLNSLSHDNAESIAESSDHAIVGDDPSSDEAYDDGCATMGGIEFELIK